MRILQKPTCSVPSLGVWCSAPHRFASSNNIKDASSTNRIVPSPTPSASTSDIATTGCSGAEQDLEPPRPSTGRRSEDPGARGR